MLQIKISHIVLGSRGALRDWCSSARVACCQASTETAIVQSNMPVSTLSVPAADPAKLMMLNILALLSRRCMPSTMPC